MSDRHLCLSIVRRDGTRVPAAGDPSAQLWRDLIRRHGTDQIQRRNLAMLALRQLGWTYQMIGDALAAHKGHVHRSVNDITHRIRAANG